MTSAGNPIEELKTLTSTLADDVRHADGGDLNTRESLFSYWSANPIVIRVIDQELGQRQQELQKYTQLIAVGMAGLARILHDGSNQGLISEQELANEDLTGHYFVDKDGHEPETLTSAHITQRRRLDNIESVKIFYERLKPETLPPWTIHDSGQHPNPIDWPAETQQDQVRTLTKLGQHDRAYDLAMTALEKTERKLASSDFNHQNWQISDQELSVHQPQAYRLRRRFQGLQSARAVLFLRIAQLEASVPQMHIALELQREAQGYIKQPDRMKYVNLQAAQAVLRYKGTGAERLGLISEVDWLAVAASVTQKLRQKISL